MLHLLTACLIVMLVVLAGCDRSAVKAAASIGQEDVVRATTAPIGSLAQRIAGDVVPIEMLCPNEQSPASWRPDPETIGRYQRASLVVINGADFETWVRFASLPRSRVVWTARAIEDELIVVQGKAHSHGPSGEHAHEETLGYTWLDPIHAIAQAGSIANALKSTYPESAAQFEHNFMLLHQELHEQHERLNALGRSHVQIAVPERPLGYLARRYRWPSVRIGDDATVWPEILNDSRQSQDTPVILLSPYRLSQSEITMLRTAYEIRVVLWETGELQIHRPYLEILAANIDRLQTAIEEVSMP